MKKTSIVICALLAMSSIGRAEAPPKLEKSMATKENEGTWDFTFKPVSALIGLIDVNIDRKISDDWTVGPELVYWNLSLGSTGFLTNSTSISIWGVGARANWFQNGVYHDGLYVGPSINYMSMSASETGSSGTASGTASVVSVAAAVGYGWFWDSFNIRLGGQVAAFLNSPTVTLTDTAGNKTSQSLPIGGLGLEFALGWTF